tara:strand:+ start:554 stop:880 length:327 start_codon:yes stop_codon:yes gene_type:complete
MNNDVLEENERSSIRGTLLGIASRLHVGATNVTDESIDPYMRELRIWIKPRMTAHEIQEVVHEKLGMKPSEPCDANNMRFRTPNCAYHSICVRRSKTGDWELALFNVE